MAEVLNIYQKLALIRKPVEIIQKNKAGYGYKYVTEDLILAKITANMNKYDVSLTPNISPTSTKVTPISYTKRKATKSGDIIDEIVNEVLVSGEMTWTWVNNSNPEDKIVVPWMFVGQQSDASQAFGSGLTYASRYFLLKFFNIATSEDDPDNWRTTQKEAENFNDATAAEEITKQINTVVREYLEKVPDDKDKVIALVKQYTKRCGKESKNYFDIKDPIVASALLEAINKLTNKK